MSTRVVEHHDAAVAEHALDLRERLVVERRVELRFGQIGDPSGPPTCTARIGRPLKVPPP